MADFKILCPACTSVLSSKKPIPNGKKITCPHCHKPFVAVTSEAAAPSDTASLDFEFDSPAAPPAMTPKHEAPKPKEKHSHASIKLPAKRGSRGVAIWSIVVGLVVLAAGGGALGMYFYLHSPEAQVGQKGKSKKTLEPKSDKHEPQVAAAAKKAKVDARKDGKTTKGPEKSGGGKSDGDKQAADAAKGDAPPPVVAAPAKRKVADWKEFKSAKGGYTIDFPIPPGERMERDEDIIYYETTAELNGFQYEVTFHRLKKDDLAIPLKDRFDKLAAEFKDTLVTKKECEFDGIPKTPVLELTLFRNDKKDVAVERWMVYKDHVFQVSVSGDKEKLGPDQVTRFMESFKFVADPQGSFLDLTQTTGIPPERKKK